VTVNLCAGQIPGKERAWRVICTEFLGPINRVPSVAVNLLLDTDDAALSPLAWADTDVGNNGENYTEPEHNLDVIVGRSQHDIIDLYSVHHENASLHDVPFTHPIALHDHCGKHIALNALFDGGALVAAMCTTVFHKIKHTS